MHAPLAQARSENSTWSPLYGRLSGDGRLLMILLAIAVMAYADLDMTLAYATSVGMGEGNPVARAVMGIKSPALVILYKSVCTITGLLILYHSRRSRVSEPAAWVVLIVMVWLMVRWSGYTSGIQESPNLFVDAAAASGEITDGHPDWIIMTP